MLQLLLIFHVLICVSLIVLILIQQGKGAEMGSAFGSGASQTVFGSQGAGSFLMKVTGIFAALFFVTSLSLGYVAGHQPKQDPLQNLTPAVINAAAQATPAQLPAAPNLNTTGLSQDQIPQQNN